MSTLSANFTILLSKEQLSQMPPVAFAGKIVVIDSPDQIAGAVAALRREALVGFDTETKPSFRKGQSHKVALMQVSGHDTCYLFRLNRTGLTDELADWLSDPSCPKVGLSLKDDFHQLHKLREFEPGGFTELQSFVGRYHIADASLQKIYGIIFGHRISKGQRLSNWEAAVLGAGQQAYAALDAWACLAIYERLLSGAFIPSESPYIVSSET